MSCICVQAGREEHWISLVRALVDRAGFAGAVGVGLAAAVDRARGRGRGAGGRRRLLPRAPLRAAARLPVPAARGGRREDQQDRDRHGRHRHALREPAVHGRGRRRGRSHRGRSPSARHQPRVTRAGDRRLAVLRLPARATARPTPTWPASTPRCCSRCSRARASPSRTRGRCSATRPACSASSPTPKASATASGGARPRTPPRGGRPRWA